MNKMLRARDLMSRPVNQLLAHTPVRDAAAFLLRHGISGAPVLDEHGRWVGVFTQNDKLVVKGFRRMGFVAEGGNEALLERTVKAYFSKLLKIRDRTPAA